MPICAIGGSIKTRHYRQEIQGGYLWSPKRNANGARNPFYESMREVSPGDLIFSFVDTRIQAIGVAQSYCWESPKPLEFGARARIGKHIGWKVKVGFTGLAHKMRPKDHIDVLGRFFPNDIRPCSPTGMAFNRFTSRRFPRRWLRF